MWSYSLTALTAQPVSVFYRPVENITNQWTPSSGTSNVALIDEEIASDTDYVYASLNNKVDEYLLEPILQPPANTDVLLKLRLKTTGSISVKIALYSGTTLIQESSTLTSASTFTNLQVIVTYATWSAANINWGNLRIRITSVI